MHQFRSNSQIAAAVNRGLAAALFQGLPAGARVMREESVPLDVATRVLLRPRRRRSTDWHY